MRSGLVAALVLLGWLFTPVEAQVFQVDLTTNRRSLLETGGAVVSGLVIDADSGLPISGANVSLELNSLPSERAPKTITDSGGVFSFTGAGPGSYRVTVSKAGFYFRQAQQFLSGAPVTVRGDETIEGIELRLRRGGAISGRIVDEFGEAVAQVQVKALRYHYVADGSREPYVSGGTDFTDDLGQFRLYGLPAGDYAVVAHRSVRALGESFIPMVLFPAPGRSDLDPLSVPTYYPGTASPDSAQMVALLPGGELALQFPLVATRGARISGRVVTSAQRPGRGMRITLRPSTGLIPILSIEERLNSEGMFSFADIPPGDYRIEVGPILRDPDGERAAMPISVTDEDIHDLTVVTGPGGTLTGRVTFDTTFRRGTFQLAARSAGGMEGSASGGVSDPVGADGSFELRGLPSSVYLEPVGSQWAITSVVVDGREMKDEPLDLSRGASLQDVSITVTDRLTVVAGQAHDERDRPLVDHVVVLLRTDAVSGPPAQRTRRLWTGVDGTFQVRGLQPGVYIVAVFEDLEMGLEHSPGFHDAVRARGHRFTLTADTPADLNLTLLPAR